MNSFTVSVNEILDFLSDENIEFHYIGSMDVIVSGASPLVDYRIGTFSWVRSESSVPEGERLFTLLVTPSILRNIDANMIVCSEPRNVYFHVLSRFASVHHSKEGISRYANIAMSATIGIGTSIGDFTVIEDDVSIGDNCSIEACVSIKRGVLIGNGCTVKSGAVLGSQGFGYYRTPAGHLAQIPHLGGVTIGNRVDIGNNSCIDRGTLGNTIICDDVKIDDLCHIAHNSYIGCRTTIIAGSTIYGSVKIGNDANIATAILREQRSVGNRSIVGMGAVVTKDVADDVTVVGNPAKLFHPN